MTPRHNGSPASIAARFVPGRGAALAFELPPVGLDADLIEPRDHVRGRSVVDRPVLAGDDLDQQFAPDRARGVVQAQQLALLARLQLRRIVGMIEAQAFDRMARSAIRSAWRRASRRTRNRAAASPAPRPGGRSRSHGRRRETAPRGHICRRAACRSRAARRRPSPPPRPRAA